MTHCPDGLRTATDLRPVAAVVIVGTGDDARCAWEIIAVETGSDIIGFVDDDERMHPIPLLGGTVIPFAALPNTDFDRLVIATRPVQTACRRAAAAGIAENRWIVPDFSSAEAFARSITRALPMRPVPVPVEGFGQLRVGIFGTGAGGAKTWEALQAMDHVEPVWFADNDARKHGTSLLGLKVIAPGEIPKDTVDRIVVGSMYRDAICQQLTAMGVDRGAIVTPDVRCPVEVVTLELSQTMPAPQIDA